MSDWQELEPDAKAAPARAPVRFGLRKVRTAPAKGRLLLRRDVVAALGMENWRCNIRLGKGARKHQIALVPDKAGRFELQELGKVKGGGTFGVTLPIIEEFPDISLPPAERSYKIETEGKRKILVVDLPTVCWNKADRDRLAAGRVA